ncbi:MAG TPA: plastocyanin/azurin family copper-binding protein [Solirubrobacteraceae bacterium]|jgi:plastocyanin|nr:plastocyanin/azurin family copper-binding protein [Solirubrobacteraceae bacterium]
MRRRALFLLASLTAALAVVLAPSGAFGGAHAARTHTVTLQEFRFHPATLNINHGDTVKWVWRDQVEHNVTFRTQHSRTQVSGTYTVRFARRGTFNYHCTIHVEEGMRGKIVVH